MEEGGKGLARCAAPRPSSSLHFFEQPRLTCQLFPHADMAYDINICARMTHSVLRSASSLRQIQLSHKLPPRHCASLGPPRHRRHTPQNQAGYTTNSISEPVILQNSARSQCLPLASPTDTRAMSAPTLMHTHLLEKTASQKLPSQSRMTGPRQEPKMATAQQSDYHP